MVIEIPDKLVKELSIIPACVLTAIYEKIPVHISRIKEIPVDYVRILSGSPVLTERTLKHFANITTLSFDDFWDKYHTTTRQPKTDRDSSLKYWKKLTKEEQQKAIDNINNYFFNLPTYSTGKPVKKARTYLADKNFNDEWKVKQQTVNRM